MNHPVRKRGRSAPAPIRWPSECHLRAPFGGLDEVEQHARASTRTAAMCRPSRLPQHAGREGQRGDLLDAFGNFRKPAGRSRRRPVRWDEQGHDPMGRFHR